MLDERHVTNRFFGWTVAALLSVTLLALASACGRGGGESAGGGLTPGTGAVAPTIAFPSVPPDSAEKAGLLVYRDSASAKVVALDLSTRERKDVGGVIAGAAASISAFDCTRDGRQIAYSNIAGNGRASVVSFAGEGAPRQSVEVQGAVQGMAWSPDGTRIVLTAIGQEGTQVQLLDVNSGEISTVPTGTGTPGVARWSPDGQGLVLDINENLQSNIYVLEIGSSEPVQVSTRPSAFTADWSPNGRTILFSAGDEQGGMPQIYAVEADGTNERKLTSSSGVQKYFPRWSLDGSLISYSGSLLVPVVSALPARLHTQAVWVTAADGTNEFPVTDITLDAVPFAWCLRGPWLE